MTQAELLSEQEVQSLRKWFEVVCVVSRPTHTLVHHVIT